MQSRSRAEEYHVADATDVDLPSWDAFLQGRSEAVAHQLSGWRHVLADASGVRPASWIARDPHGAIAGVLATYLSRSRFTGVHLATMEGGAVARNHIVSTVLFGAAMQRAREWKAQYLLVRGGFAPGAPTRTMCLARHVVDLDNGSAGVWRTLANDRRRKVRLAERAGVEIVRDDGALKAWYALYARRMKELGTPVESRSFFDAMRRHLGDAFCLLAARREARLVAGMICLRMPGRWTYAYGARDTRDRVHANDLLFWRAIETAALAGARLLDLGASMAGSGADTYKRRWGQRTENVEYAFYPVGGSSIPRGVDTYRGQRSVPQRIWARMPGILASHLGPRLRRQLPFA